MTAGRKPRGDRLQNPAYRPARVAFLRLNCADREGRRQVRRAGWLHRLPRALCRRPAHLRGGRCRHGDVRHPVRHGGNLQAQPARRREAPRDAREGGLFRRDVDPRGRRPHGLGACEDRLRGRAHQPIDVRRDAPPQRGDRRAHAAQAVPEVARDDEAARAVDGRGPRARRELVRHLRESVGASRHLPARRRAWRGVLPEPRRRVDCGPRRSGHGHQARRGPREPRHTALRLQAALEDRPRGRRVSGRRGDRHHERHVRERRADRHGTAGDDQGRRPHALRPRRPHVSRQQGVGDIPVPLPPLANLPGIGAARARELAEAGVETALDLLLHLPFRYEDRTRIAPIAALVPEGPATTVKGTVLSARLIRTRRRGFTIFEAILDDGSGPLRLVFFNQPYLQRWLLPKKIFWVYGVATQAARYRRGLVMENPQIEEFLEGEEGKDPLSVGRVVPIYRKLPALTPRARRRLVSHLLRDFADRLPERLHDIAEREQGFPSLADSLREAHFPGSAGGPADAEPWTERTSPYLHRLVYEEFLEFQVGLQKRRRERAADPAPILAADEQIRARLRAVLPFSLTAAQKRVIREIGEDFRRGTPMRRLLQGDVGSGKTIVAVLSAVLAAACGYQTAVMAPTEILAEQHAATIFRLLAKSGLVPALLTGRVKGKARSALLDQLAGGRINLLVGTHALLENPVEFLRLGLIVIDEQHRFGVAQRTALAAKADGTGKKPHLLVMSATPIPRSLALTLYGDLDV